MHKDEAASLFLVLSDPNTVKILKMLYNFKELSKERLEELIDDSNLSFKLSKLLESKMIFKENDNYKINKEYVDTLLDFIRKPCGCMKA